MYTYTFCNNFLNKGQNLPFRVFTRYSFGFGSIVHKSKYKRVFTELRVIDDLYVRQTEHTLRKAIREYRERERIHETIRAFLAHIHICTI